jgi:hypothetical protein
VEASRQWQSPRNAVQVLRALLRHGADPDAVAGAYGGGLTPWCALVSSAHPARAGVQGGLVEVLCRGGANPNGLDEDGAAAVDGHHLRVPGGMAQHRRGMARYRERHDIVALLEA